MSLDQYNTLMSGILNQWYAFAKLKTVIEDRKKKCIENIESLGIWPTIARIEKRKQKKNQFPRINLRW